MERTWAKEADWSLFPAEWSWVTLHTAFSLSFPIYKMDITTPTFQDCGKDSR